MALPEERMPPGYNEKDFVFSKLYKSVNFIGEHVMCEVVRSMYSHNTVLSNGGNMPLKDYLSSVMGWKSNTKFKKINKFPEAFYLENMMINDFDTAYGGVVMKEACPELYKKLSDVCRENIEELIKMRNQVCHKYGVEINELRSLVENLKNMLAEIYKGVGEVVVVDFTSNSDSMKTQLNDILNCNVRQNDFDAYLKDVEEFRKSKKFRLISAGRKELQNCYNTLPCDITFSKFIRKDTSEDVDVNDILKVTKEVNSVEEVLCALFIEGSEENCKSLSYYVVHDWCKEEDDMSVGDLKDFNLVIFVDVRRPQPEKLREFLKSRLLMETSQNMISDLENFNDSDIIPTLEDIDVLFIIDGFDEAVSSSLELVKDIFSRFRSRNHRILMTTHPDFLADAKSLIRQVHIDLSFLLMEISGVAGTN